MRRRPYLLIAAIVSALVHLAAALVVLLLPRALPTEAQPHQQGTVELLMVERKGAQPSQAAQPNGVAPTPGAPPKSDPAKADAKPEPKAAPKSDVLHKAAGSKPLQPKPPELKPPELKPEDSPEIQDQKAVTPPLPLMAATAPASEAAAPALPALDASPAPPESSPLNPPMAEQAAEAPPTPSDPDKALVLDLGGTDSESNATVLGGQVVPAMADDRFRNRPPVYPVEAEIRGEHGSVLVIIHIAVDGLATGVDVLESSGHDLLDQSVLTAVRKWHFRPAMKAGQNVPSDMQFRVIFEPK